MKSGLRMAVEQKQWTDAAIRASNLCELRLDTR